jgi:hypothetical protein
MGVRSWMPGFGHPTLWGFEGGGRKIPGWVERERGYVTKYHFYTLHSEQGKKPRKLSKRGR